MRPAEATSTLGVHPAKARTLAAAAVEVSAASEVPEGCVPGCWRELGTLHLCDYGTKPSASVAAFDLDGTLIDTKSGKVFAEGPTDWRWWHPKVPEKLRALSSEGRRLVVVSNQSGIGKGTGDKSKHRQKLDAIQRELGLPLLVLVATGDDEFRKPRTGAWAWLSSAAGGGLAPDAARSFFVGDAAGRAELKKPKTKKDFSDSDLKFALNVGVEFWTPDRFFLGPDADRQRPSALEPASAQEVVVLVGPPGAGKTSLAGDR